MTLRFIFIPCQQFSKWSQAWEFPSDTASVGLHFEKQTSKPCCSYSIKDSSWFLFMLYLCSGSKYLGISMFFRNLELFGGGEGNFRKFLFWSRSLLTSEGVPLDPLIGFLHCLPNHWYLHHSTVSPSSWLALVQVCSYLWQESSKPSLFIDPYIYSFVDVCSNFTAYIWALCMPSTWLKLGIQWYAKLDIVSAIREHLF